jgi:hypothetical protein
MQGIINDALLSYMRKIFIIFLLITASVNAVSQIRRDAIWCFGDSAQIDFNQQPPLVTWCATRSRGTACSIADSSGNLLFYCHTFYLPPFYAGYDKLGVVWNKNNEVMENGDSIVGRGWYREMVILPNVMSNTKYYLFHSGISTNGQLYYSVIDISQNGGLGKVIQKNILLDSLNGEHVSDGLTAIKHGNGRDWWIIFRSYGSNANNSFHKYLITPFGIQNFPNQNIGNISYSGWNRIKFNNKGSQFVLYNIEGLLEIYDFDRCIGNIINVKLIHPEAIAIENSFWSAEFSPNDSVLYVSTEDTRTYLFQFNLTASNIYNSKIILDSINYPLYSGSDLKLAIDGKIYRSTLYYDGTINSFPYADSVYNSYNMNLSVINEPNILGLGCNYQPYSFYLGGKRTYAGLPNNPYYDMPALGGSICDTLGLPNGIRIPEKSAFTVFPNPARDKIYFNASNYLEEKPVVKIFDFTGKIVFEKQVTDNTIEVSKFSQGLYTVSFFVNGVYHSSVKFTVLK